MSALSSPPHANRPRAHLVGFNDHTYDDPVLPSSPSEEELLQLISPLPQYSYVSSPSSNADLPNAGSKIPSTTSRSQSHHQGQPNPPSSHFSNSIGLYTSSISPQSHSVSPPPVTTNTFLSPAAAYYSDNGYSELSEITTPSFGDDLFGLEADFGPLAALPEELEHLQESTGVDAPESVDADTQKIHQFDNTQRTLFEAATPSHSSRFINPVWTKTASSGSGDGAGGPAMETIYFRRGDSYEPTTQHFSEPPMQAHSSVHVQQPSAPTGSSNDAESSDAKNPHSIQHTASPVVHVETYSRGDSPARVTSFLGQSGRKRSRTSHSRTRLNAEREHETSKEEEPVGSYDSDSESLPVYNGQRDVQSNTMASEERFGLDPTARSLLSDDHVPNFKDQTETAEAAQKFAEVEDWIAHSAAGSEAGDVSTAPSKPRGANDSRGRRRARSMIHGGGSGAHAFGLDSAFNGYDDSKIPGPGVLLDEESGDEEEEDSEDNTTESPPAAIDVNSGATETIESYFSSMQEEPLRHRFYCARPWQDPPSNSLIPEIKMQPDTSNAAIMRFSQLAGDVETASRVATWGTRRLSEADIEKVLGPGGPFHRMSIGKDQDRTKDKAERRGSFFEQAAAKLRRSSSNLKRHGSDHSKQQTAASAMLDLSRKENFESPLATRGNLAVPNRVPSTSKLPRSPKINTSSAVAAMTSQIAAIGGSGSVSATAASPPPGPWASAKNAMKRTRSRSDLKGFSSGGAPDLGIADLWNKSGGPPIPTLASPPVEKPNITPTAPVGDPEEEDDDDEDHDEVLDEKGVVMDLTIRADLIVPTFEGFKSNVRQLNPRLEPFMVDRIGQEQLRRYKKLAEFKVNHLKATKVGKCNSGKLCPTLGGEPVYLPAKASGKEPELSHTGFSYAGIAPSDDDANAHGEGIVTAAQFPPGVPMPPVKRLPAEFECYLCFKVKKFHKPSDWSKHVHEDVQPFTCTFAQCSEPKSFKRKADWVRHENERHRQLEWWTCNIQDCTHTCYRKDNFVQHLVREHKLPEPKAKVSKPTKPAVRGPSNHKSRTTKLQMDFEDWNEGSSGFGGPGLDDVDRLWALVDERRQLTEKDPRGEPCKFCGNVCISWKKLTVHLAKHMEQISMPILTLVKQRDVTPETIISPIEQRISQPSRTSPTSGTKISQNGSARTSPYDQPASQSTVPANYAGSFNPPYAPTDYSMPTGQNQRMPAWQAGQATGLSRQLNSQSPTVHYSEAATTTYSAPPYPAYDHTPMSQFMPVNVATNFSSPGSIPSQNALYERMKDHTLQPSSTAYVESGPYYAAYGPQQQQSGPLYPYPDNVSTSYFQQSTMGAPMLSQYNNFPSMPYAQPPIGASAYQRQRPQDYPYNQ